MTVEDRNFYFEEKEHLIHATMSIHYPLIRACRMEENDVYQQLSLRMIKALDAYDPARCQSMDGYLMLQLRYELLHMKDSSKLTGVVRAPRNGFRLVSLEAREAAGYAAQDPGRGDASNVLWLEHEIDLLPKDQKNALSRLLSGERVTSRNRALQAARQRIRERLMLSGRLQYA